MRQFVFEEGEGQLVKVEEGYEGVDDDEFEGMVWMLGCCSV